MRSIAGFLVAATVAAAQPPFAPLGAFADMEMRESGVPGAAIAVIPGDKVVDRAASAEPAWRSTASSSWTRRLAATSQNSNRPPDSSPPGALAAKVRAFGKAAFFTEPDEIYSY